MEVSIRIRYTGITREIQFYLEERDLADESEYKRIIMAQRASKLGGKFLVQAITDGGGVAALPRMRSFRVYAFFLSFLKVHLIRREPREREKLISRDVAFCDTLRGVHS